jgi:hypothetical protein
MRFKLYDIKKETFRLFNSYFGFKAAQETSRQSANTVLNAKSPDFYNSDYRKKVSTSPRPH